MAKLWCLLCIITLLQLSKPVISKREVTTPPPLPVLPLPSFSQLKWQERELIMFPSLWWLNANQWVNVAAEAGFSLVILTAKHHDGFCLWPSKYTDHSVAKSPWKNGRGDVVQELVNAAGAHGGIDVGLYLSPWDRHDRRYGHDLQYNEYYLAQLQELLHKYGKVREIWFDGAKGSNVPNMSYYFSDWFSMVKELQSSINIFSDAGPDVRWVGNEMGFAGSTCWSTINRTSLSIGNGSIVNYLNAGDPKGTDWLPAECDVSIRKGWFWHKSESPKRLSTLLDIYYKSVGRNCVLLFNVPPNSTGLISENDVQRLREFRAAIDTIFSTNLAENCFVAGGTTVGHKRLHRLEKGAVKGQIVRIKILRSRSVPLISSIGLHYDPFWHPEKI
ncbi:ALPHA-L-FUCOSIDASE [Salix koriyanagi]|uniref:alpha-L-fucosidase n=1 Tax=Salix koriyanagi TaxID=2511006 RepID=A0A9Q0WET3_9ROSI|nr:ALPHA-L-FUCOSIDASE [Salix koriyanagi]